MTKRWWAALLLFSACGISEPRGDDAGATLVDEGVRVDPPDAALPDAALPDLALPDAALPDAALPDAQSFDASPADSGPIGPRAEYLDVIRCPQSTPACLLSFGRIAPGTTERQTITLQNTWPEALTVSSITLNSPEFTLRSATSLVLASMGTAVVEVEYHPTVPGVHRAVLTIHSDAVRNPERTVPVEGGADLTSPCAESSECLYQESCAGMSCASCPLPTPPPCFDGTLGGEAYGNACHWPYCRCPSGSYYAAGHCLPAASCAQGQACGGGLSCNAQLSCAFPAQYCPDPPGFCE